MVCRVFRLPRHSEKAETSRHDAITLYNIQIGLEYSQEMVRV